MHLGIYQILNFYFMCFIQSFYFILLRLRLSLITRLSDNWALLVVKIEDSKIANKRIYSDDKKIKNLLITKKII